MLLAGSVRVAGETVTKPGTLFPPEVEVELVARPPFVSRGGEKLAHALAAFRIEAGKKVCVDVGASTGGFTDCLLQRGASRVYAVDVGYGELDYRLREDSRVVVMERTNARDLLPLPEECDLATFDVSFIGVDKVIPAVRHSLRPDADLVVLVKPQFQGNRTEVGKNGVVRDALTHAAILGRTIAWAAGQGLHLRGLTTSPLVGPAGNREFFLHLNSGRPDE